MKNLSYKIQTAALRAAAAVVRILPEQGALQFGVGLGRVGFSLAGYRRQVALTNVDRAFGNTKSAAEKEEIVRQVFENLGLNAVEVFRFPDLTAAQLRDKVECSTTHLFDEALAGGKGAILLAAHLGNWELFAGWVAAIGYPLDAVVKPQRNQSADRFYNHLRSSTGLGIIPTQKASRQILVSLKQNRLVGILADQFAGDDGIPIKFFGRETSTHHGPAAIALKLGCPIIHGALIRLPEGRHLGICGGPMKITRSGDREKDVRRLTQEYTLIIENYIRRNPGQWLWTHRRWKDVS